MFILELQIDYSTHDKFGFGAGGQLYQVTELSGGCYRGFISGREESSSYICNENDANTIFHGSTGSYYINLLIDADTEENIDIQNVKERWINMFKDFVAKEKELLDNELNNILNSGSKYINK